MKLRAEKFNFGSESGDYSKEWKIEDHEVKITIKKALTIE